MQKRGSKFSQCVQAMTAPSPSGRGAGDKGKSPPLAELSPQSPGPGPEAPAELGAGSWRSSSRQGLAQDAFGDTAGNRMA